VALAQDLALSIPRNRLAAVRDDPGVFEHIGEAVLPPSRQVPLWRQETNLTGSPSRSIFFQFNRLGSHTIGQRLARYKGMLRITLPSSDGPGIVVLEGRLAGLWAQELLRVSREANHGPGSIFDLQEVFYVDSIGEDALKMLNQVGARFITDTAYGKDLCHRLKLRRVSQPKPSTDEERTQRDARSSAQPPEPPSSPEADFPDRQRSCCRE